MTPEEKKKHPDFNEWLLTKDGKECNDFSNLKEQRFLQNRLFWAFDAGRNCVWDQYQEQKKLLSSLREEIEKEKKRSLNQTTRSHADISYECGLDFTLKLLDSLTPKK